MGKSAFCPKPSFRPNVQFHRMAPTVCFTTLGHQCSLRLSEYFQQVFITIQIKLLNSHLPDILQRAGNRGRGRGSRSPLGFSIACILGKISQGGCKGGLRRATTWSLSQTGGGGGSLCQIWGGVELRVGEEKYLGRRGVGLLGGGGSGSGSAAEGG